MRTVTLVVDRVERETDLAFLFFIGQAEVWVPKSCVEDADAVGEGDTDVEVEVAEWFAEREDLV